MSHACMYRYNLWSLGMGIIETILNFRRRFTNLYTIVSVFLTHEQDIKKRKDNLYVTLSKSWPNCTIQKQVVNTSCTSPVQVLEGRVHSEMKTFEWIQSA